MKPLPAVGVLVALAICGACTDDVDPVATVAAHGRSAVAGDLEELVHGPDRADFVDESELPEEEYFAIARSLPPSEQEALWQSVLASIRGDPRYRDLVSKVLTRSPLAEDAEEGPEDWFRLLPVPGLVPLGRDADSGLHEFAVIGTGTIRLRNPQTGRVPIEEDSAITLVLVPGGSFRMGAQPKDPEGPGYDPDALPDEGPVRRVELQSFLLARTGCTNAQLRRLGTVLKDAPPPSDGGPGDPAAAVTWTEARRVLFAAGLRLPSESEFEYAARFFDVRSDESRAALEDPESATPVVDRSAVEGMLEGVAEWCEDVYQPDYGYAPTTGVPFVLRRDRDDEEERVIRGWPAEAGGVASAARRHRRPAEFRAADVGFRAAMTLPVQFRPAEAPEDAAEDDR